MKKYKVKKAEPIALEFEDGKTIELCFNMKALMFLGEELSDKKISLKGPEFFSAIIYSGIKACNEDYSKEEADALYVTLSESYPEALNGILDEYCEASGVDTEELKKNAIMGMIQ